MKRMRWWLPVVLGLALTVVGAVERASAEEIAAGAATTASDGSSDETDRWWGVAGAVLCGTEIRMIRVAPVVGMNPYVLAAGIAGCLLFALDATT